MVSRAPLFFDYRSATHLRIWYSYDQRVLVESLTCSTATVSSVARFTEACGGGVALYINTFFTFLLIDSNVSSDHISIDIVRIYVSLPDKRIAVFSVYRSPRAPLSESLFHRIRHLFCGRLHWRDSMGDFNINMLDANNSGVSHVNDLMSLFLLS